MANYVYKGPGPHWDAPIGLVHPGDVREFDAEPGWGAWELMPGDERQSAAGPAPAQAGANGGQPTVPPAPPVTPPATTPAKGTEGGM